MRKFVSLVVVVVILALSARPTFAESNSIAAIAAGNSDFSTLVAAADAAGLVKTLDSSGPFTVFAPTNAAFAALLRDLNLTAEQLLTDRALLRSVLLYHVVPGRVAAADIPKLLDSSGRLYAETVNGSRVAITVEGSRVFINSAQVIAADIQASNGIIHVIDRVILPPSHLFDTALGANMTGDFDILLAAINATGLGRALSSGGPFTILAPTDRAFEALSSTLGVSPADLLANTSLLRDVLLYHVIRGEFYSGDITAAVDGQGTFEVPTLNGDTVTVTVNGGFIKVDAANVIAINIVASNGVIHVIDAVILPD